MKDSDIEDTAAEAHDNNIASKKAKFDPFAEFRNAALDTSKRSDHAFKDFEVDIEEEFQCYSSIAGVSLQQPEAVRSVFDPLLWWGQQMYSLPFFA